MLRTTPEARASIRALAVGNGRGEDELDRGACPDGGKFDFRGTDLLVTEQDQSFRLFCFAAFFSGVRFALGMFLTLGVGLGFAVGPEQNQQRGSKNGNPGDDRQLSAVHEYIPHCAASLMSSAAACPWSSCAAIRASRMSSRASAALSTSISGKRPLR